MLERRNCLAVGYAASWIRHGETVPSIGGSALHASLPTEESPILAFWRTHLGDMHYQV